MNKIFREQNTSLKSTNQNKKIIYFSHFWPILHAKNKQFVNLLFICFHEIIDILLS